MMAEPDSYVEKILIVDDEENLRRTLARILRTSGRKTVEARNGREALERMAQERFDLVYLDIHMPEMSGIELLENVRRSDPETPVIILTGYGTLETAVDAVRLGAIDYLLKPYDPATIVARTETALQDQAIRRRKADLRRKVAELRERLESLLAELDALERDAPERPAPGAAIPTQPDRFIKVGKLVMDLHARRATLGDRLVTLPPAAFDYLAVLARRSPAVVDYKTLVSEAQGYNVDAGEASELAKWHVHGIRQALEADLNNPQHVITVRGVGYRLVPEAST